MYTCLLRIKRIHPKVLISKTETHKGVVARAARLRKAYLSRVELDSISKG